MAPKATKPKGKAAARPVKPKPRPKVQPALAQPPQQPQEPERKPVQPVASPQEHAKMGQDLRGWAESEEDPQRKVRLDSLAALNEALSKRSAESQAQPSETTKPL